MPSTGAVWGIDIGQCALKALRCRPGDEPDKVLADAFDFIEYPKILSQPEADPVELVQEALKTFLSRNSVKGDKVAISVSGQSGLARFVKLPPVEAKKIPDLVKFEARQQIPFALEDVVWDYQQMPGGSVEEGFALETEVGLFAMKRDQVFRALRPFRDAGIEVDFVQLTPITLYNFVVFDQMPDLPPPEEYDPEKPPKSIVVLSLGTDTTDLVVTNGFRVWQRSIPLGGNHFTKALTKEMKLTFAKAEHLKRNATKAQDPKAVFQAMRPVFHDLLTEVHRSLSFFGSVDRNATISKVLVVGNAIKLQGLQKYLAQNLEMNVVQLDAYRGITGPQVVSAPAFQDNLLTFGVCYGLALQGLGKGKLSTNLVPPELIKDRLIREKKPWAVAAVAALLIGCAVAYVGQWQAWAAVHPDKYKDVFGPAEQAKSASSTAVSAYNAKLEEYKKVAVIGDNLLRHVDRRLMWIELSKAIAAAIPKETRDPKPPVADREELHIVSMDCQYFDDLTVWYTGVKNLGKEAPVVGAAAAPAAAPAADAAAPAAEDPGPTGPGWVIQLLGYHYHNNEQGNSGAQFIRNTLLKSLKEGSVQLMEGNNEEQLVTVPMRELGISYPVLVSAERNARTQLIDPTAPPVLVKPPKTARGRAATATTLVAAPPIILQRTNFLVQFCWVPTPRGVRIEKRKATAAAKAEAAQAAGAEGAASDTLAAAPSPDQS